MEYIMQPVKYTVATAMCLIVAMTLCARAQVAPAKAEPPPPQTEIRTYELSELVQTIPDYPLPPEPANENAAGGAAKIAPGQPNTPANSGTPIYDEKLDSLIRLIEDTVDPASWKDNGGSIGSLSMLGRQLVVSQTADNQHAVQMLLDSLMSNSVLVEIDARWALLTPEQLDALRGAAPAVAQTLDRLTKDADAFYCQGRLVGFNGQTVSLTSGQMTTVVTGVTPVVGTGVAAYDVETASERSGVSLQVTPRLAAHHNGIVVDVHSKVTQDIAGTGRPLGLLPIAATQPGDTKPADAPRLNLPPSPLGRPDRLETAFNTTVRLIPGTPLVIGGMTREPGKQGSRQLCLILTARTLDAPADKPDRGK
jgi:hypothetical protein